MKAKAARKPKPIKPVWEAKLVRRGKNLFVDVSRTLRLDKNRFQFERVTFAFPATKRFCRL